MKNFICIIISLYMTISCSNNNHKQQVVSKEKNTKTIEYDLSQEIETTEGAGAIANYVDGKNKKMHHEYLCRNGAN